MNEAHRCRWLLAGIVAIGLVVLQVPSSVWAQLETVDPALHAAVEALIANDPTIANDSELAEICRQVAEATVLDPAERAAVTSEVVALHREGVDVGTVIPTEVREAAREQFNQVQGQMREQLETLRATDPQRAQEVELMLQEGERCMLAFESGEPYTPSPEMVAHAEGMMREWESEMLANGAPPEYIERAREEFARWSSGEMTEMMEMMGPGHEMGGPGGMPSLEQMEQMVANGQMTPEQFQMAQEYMQGGFEAFGPMGGFESYQAGMEAYHAGMEYGQMMEQYGAMMEQYGQMMEHQYMEQYQMEQQYFENQNYDNLQQQQFENVQQHVLISEHRIANGDGHDEGHWDGNGDMIADHTHPLGTTSH
jgi:hypothetical protein